LNIDGFPDNADTTTGPGGDTGGDTGESDGGDSEGDTSGDISGDDGDDRKLGLKHIKRKDNGRPNIGPSTRAAE